MRWVLFIIRWGKWSTERWSFLAKIMQAGSRRAGVICLWFVWSLLLSILLPKYYGKDLKMPVSSITFECMYTSPIIKQLLCLLISWDNFSDVFLVLLKLHTQPWPCLSWMKKQGPTWDYYYYFSFFSPVYKRTVISLKNFLCSLRQHWYPCLMGVIGRYDFILFTFYTVLHYSWTNHKKPLQLLFLLCGIFKKKVTTGFFPNTQQFDILSDVLQGFIKLLQWICSRGSAVGRALQLRHL